MHTYFTILVLSGPIQEMKVLEQYNKWKSSSVHILLGDLCLSLLKIKKTISETKFADTLVEQWRFQLEDCSMTFFFFKFVLLLLLFPPGHKKLQIMPPRAEIMLHYLKNNRCFCALRSGECCCKKPGNISET